MITWCVQFLVTYRAPNKYRFSEQFVVSSTDHNVIMDLGEFEAGKRAFRKHCELVGLDVTNVDQMFTENVN
jgi:hypothetical protein